MGGPCLGAFGMIRKSLSAFEPSRVKYVKLRRYRFKMDAFAGHWLQHFWPLGLVTEVTRPVWFK